MARQQREPDGPPPAPVVQRLRLRYAKRGRLRFTSTRDFQRALERAVRRAQVPVAFSAGFHPHPRISYANAAPTGVASEAEYVELALSQRRDPESVRALLDEALPTGLDLVEVLEVVPGQSGSLADRLEASDWAVALAGVDRDTLERAVDAFLAADRIEVTRVLKTGPRTFDVRGPVAALWVDTPAGMPDAATAPTPECAILRVVVRHSTPATRPDDVLTALRAVAGLEPPTPPLVTRLAQGPLQDGSASVTHPWAPDEKAAGA